MKVFKSGTYLIAGNLIWVKQVEYSSIVSQNQIYIQYDFKNEAIITIPYSIDIEDLPLIALSDLTTLEKLIYNAEIK